MSRLIINSAVPADVAELISDVDDSYSVEEESFIAHRTDELLAERIADRDRFRDLLDGIDAGEIDGPLHRALMNLDRAIQGEIAGETAVFIALSLIQSRIRIEARIVWAEECRAEAERQLTSEGNI